MAKHDKLAGLLGLLPHTLLSLLKETHPRNSKQAASELQIQTVWGAYTIWKKRQILQKIHWNQKVPEIRKKEKKANRTGPPNKKRRLRKAEQFDACINPFHYLELSKPNVAPEFTCRCNYRIPTTYITQREISFFNSDEITDQKILTVPLNPKRKLNLSKLEGKIDASYFEQKYSNRSLTRNTQHVKKSGQISTEHQDRSKRFKPTSPILLFDF